jgi:hypothetical protein
LAGVAYGINDSGQAIAQDYESPGVGRIYVYSPVAKNGYSQGMNDLTPNGSEDGFPLAVGINNFGDALYDAAPFTYMDNPSVVFQAYLRVGSAHAGLQGGTTYTLVGTKYDMYQAVGLNDSDEVVGMAAIGPAGATYDTPALWTPSAGAVDLNSFISLHSGWTLQTVTAIDELGDIEGTGLYEGVSTPFILWAPEPTSSMVVVMAMIPLALTRRPRHRWKLPSSTCAVPLLVSCMANVRTLI